MTTVKAMNMDQRRGTFVFLGVYGSFVATMLVWLLTAA